MMRFCEFSDAFGPVNEGAHFHWHGVAIVDVLLTFFGAYLIYLFLRRFQGIKSRNMSGLTLYFLSFIFLFAVSVSLHHIFCVCTTMNMFLFPDDPVCQGIGQNVTTLDI